MVPADVPTRMSESDETPGLVTRAYRTVTPAPRGHEDSEMNAIGWGMFLALLLLLVPLLPFVVIVWFVSKVIDTITPGRDT